MVSTYIDIYLASHVFAKYHVSIKFGKAYIWQFTVNKI